jgi:hypothetical protein
MGTKHKKEGSPKINSALRDSGKEHTFAPTPVGRVFQLIVCGNSPLPFLALGRGS